MSTCAKRGRWRSAAVLLEEFGIRRLTPDPLSFSSLTSALATCLVIHVFHGISFEGGKAYLTLVSLLPCSDQKITLTLYPSPFFLISKSLVFFCSPPFSSFPSAIICPKNIKAAFRIEVNQVHWQKALQVALLSGESPTAVSAALTACGVAAAWPMALQLWGVTPVQSAPSVQNAAVGAMASATQWEKAMEMLPEVRFSRIKFRWCRL